MIQINLIGRIGKDLKPQTVNYNGKTFTTLGFTVASERRDKDGNKIADWFYCQTSGKRAEAIVKYCKKGSMIAINGTMEQYKDKDGNSQLKVKIEKVKFLDFKNEKKTTESNEPNIDHLPF